MRGFPRTRHAISIALCSLIFSGVQAATDPIGLGFHQNLEPLVDEVFVGDPSLFPNAPSNLARCYNDNLCPYYRDFLQGSAIDRRFFKDDDDSEFFKGKGRCKVSLARGNYTLDQDLDGIPNVFEGGPDDDFDGDGNPNFTDFDSDFDGIKDVNEHGLPPLKYKDCNDNGVDDAIDVVFIGGPDENGDFIRDDIKPVDTDEDSQFDFLDTDSDQDGIPDRVERDVERIADIDVDRPETLPTPKDSDGDCIPDFRDMDSDNDKIADKVEGFNVPDLTYLDDDIDGIDNAIDVDLTGGPDLNNNNVDDRYEPIDTDLAGSPDYIDLDSDSDSISDTTEVGLSGTEDFLIYDNPLDSDFDTVPNYRDLDSDNDGLLDIREAQQVDVNGDGMKDLNSNVFSVPGDTDLDEQQDYVDVDFNGDGVFDHFVTIAGPYDDNGDGAIDGPAANPAYRDTDKDGIPDVIDHRPEVFGDMFDMDFDTIFDAKDLDDDNDGIPDKAEQSKSPQGIYTDLDSDNDGRVNRLDRDSDNDGLTDTVEGYEDISLDSDRDGTVDNFVDANQDGFHDELLLSMQPVNIDGDDKPDFLDLDTDADTLLDLQESTVRRDEYDADQNGLMDADIDRDIDGLTDIIDASVPGDDAGIGLEVLDDDNNGLPNFRQVDDPYVTPTPTPDITPTPDVSPTPTPDVTPTPTVTPDPSETPTPSETPIPSVTPSPSPAPSVTPSPTANPTPTPDGDGGEGEDELTTAVRGAGAIDGGMILGMMALLLGLRFRRQLKALPVLGLTVIATGLSSPSTTLASAELCGVNPYPNEEQGDFDFEPCFYGGIGLGRSDVDPEGSVNGWSLSDNHDTAYKLFLGYHFSKHLFAEFSYSDLGEAELRNSDPAITGTGGVGYEVPAFFAGYITDLTPRLDLFGKVGISLIQNEGRGDGVRVTKENDVQLAFGGGLQYRLTDRLFARLELDTFDRDAKYVGLALGSYLGDHSKPEPVPIVVADVEPTPQPKPFCRRYQGDIAPVYFDSDKSNINDEAQEHLIHVAGILNEYSELNLEIRAHADSTASDAYNMALTERRAQAVVDFIVSHNISNKRLKPIALGESQPVADNSTKAGRALNRRAEFVKIVIKTTDDCIEP